MTAIRFSAMCLTHSFVTRSAPLCMGVSLLTLLGCGEKAAAPAPVKNAQAIAAPAPAQACGVAPAGEYTAERIAAANTSIENYQLYEGPVWVKDALYFSDFSTLPGFPSRIHRLDEQGMTTYLEDSGTNGLAIDDAGNLLAGTHKFKSVSRYNLATKERSSIVENFNGNVFNSPNDLTLAKNGSLYFSDPDFQKAAAPGGQPLEGVYQLTKDGVITLVDGNIYHPNGVSLSPNNDVLYVAGGGEKGFLRAYPIVDGVPQTGKNIVDPLETPDGMTVDCLGNIYATEHAKQRVRVFKPTGEQIATIHVDANITNVAFGGADGKTLFMTGQGAVWKLPLSITGSPY